MPLARSCRRLSNRSLPPYCVRVIEVQDVRLDPDSRRAWRGDQEITFSRKEYDLVLALIARAGDIVTR